MTREPDAEPLIGRTADERLLAEDPSRLPIGIGRPEAPAASPTRGRVVGVGATLTAASLVIGIVLIAVGGFEAISGDIGLRGIAGIVLGVILVGTHWGWVHVAEATADAIERRRDAPVVARRRRWLETIEPYARYEITTSVADDGCVTIDRLEYRPVPAAADTFTFHRRVQRLAVFSGDGAAATVAERAETLRQQAADDTDRERRRFQLTADDHQRALLGEHDRREELAVHRAASAALSEEINARLRDPPVA